MKHFVSFLALSLVVCGASAAQNSSRPAMSGKMIMAAPRATASINQLNGMASVGVKNDVAPHTDPVVTTPEKKESDRREAERNACINNNIGIGNTFVWASRYSDTSNYASMVEDVEKPENNVCFVRVELKSDDESRISVSDVPAKYFMWGETIECGSWADAKEMEQRILNAKKGARIGGIVASSVGGAGLGVGAMELFGNKVIGGKVQGQKAMTGLELYRSQLLVMKEKNPSEFTKIRDALITLKNSGESLSPDTKALVNEFAK